MNDEVGARLAAALERIACEMERTREHWEEEQQRNREWQESYQRERDLARQADEAVPPPPDPLQQFVELGTKVMRRIAGED